MLRLLIRTQLTKKPFLTIYTAHVFNMTNTSLNEQPLDDKTSGGRLNKKDGLTRYGDSHVKDKTS